MCLNHLPYKVVLHPIHVSDLRHKYISLDNGEIRDQITVEAVVKELDIHPQQTGLATSPSLHLATSTDNNAVLGDVSQRWIPELFTRFHRPRCEVTAKPPALQPPL